MSASRQGPSKRFQPSTWTERLVPLILLLLLFVLVAVIIFVVLSILGFIA